jgi:hydrophobe/amphiphile efflux-3 (HAE3) family protein
MVDRFARLIADHPIATLVAVLGLTLLAVSGIVDFRSGEMRLRLEPELDRLMPLDEARRYYDDMRRRFGNDDTLTVAVVSEDVFSPEILPRVARMTERFEEVEGIRRVVSLSTALNIRGHDGELSIEPFYTGLPEDPAELAAMRREALENPIYAGNLVSRNGRATALVVHLRKMSEAEFIDARIDVQLAAIAEEERGTAEVWMTGPPQIRAETSRVLLSDLRFVVPTAFAICAMVAAVAFRSLRGVVIPATTILLSLVWTLGAMAWAGRPLNLVTTILPPLILTIGLAYSIHVVAAYYAVLRKGAADEPRELVRQALRDVGLPVLLTALTTSVGFLALTVSRLPAIREFAVFATVGVATTVAVSLTYVPALLRILPPPRRTPSAEGAARLDRGFEAVARFDLRHRSAIFVVAILVCVVSLYGLSRVRVSNDLITNFHPDSPVRVHFDAINESLEGSNPFYVVLEGDERDTFKRPANLRVVEDLQRWLEEQPGIGSTTSLVDYVKVINWGFHENDPDYRAIPETAALTDQLLFFGGNEELDAFVDPRYKTTRIVARATVIDSVPMRAVVERVREHLATLPGHIHPRVTGNTVLVNQTVDDLTRGQAQSLTLAFVAIYGILSLLFTSFRVGFIALIPNAIPVLIYFGAIGLTGVDLNPNTSLVACLVLGIAVDDSIHYMTRFARSARKRADERQGTIDALRGVGRPITATTIALCLGFLTMTFTNLRMEVEFGAFAAFTMFAAWLIDMTLTPALCSGLRIVTLWDVLTLDLGREPQNAIPIFRGLTRRQARVVALMTHLRSVKKESALFERGERGQEMYVVIEGELVASIEHGGVREELSRLRRGDVVGEVAPFHGTRTADVDVTEDALLLRLTLADLERVRRHYPRIGAIVYRNLSDLLADRVANTMEHVL